MSLSRGESLLEEVAVIVRRDFYDPALRGVDFTRLVDEARKDAALAETATDRAAVINRVLGALGASHTRLYIPEETGYFDLLDLFAPVLERDPRFPPHGGLRTTAGFSTVQLVDRTFVNDVLEGSPAEAAGLLVGDLVLAVDGAPFAPVASFAGKAGRVVEIEIQRSADPASRRTLRMVPQELRPSEMYLAAERASARVLPRDGRRIGLVRVRSYAGAVFHEALEELVTDGGPLAEADALVLDLRGPWGGASPEYLELFDRTVPRLKVSFRDGESSTQPPRWRKPVVLLVDGSVRSGKEVLAFGFRRGRIGPVVGERTAGAVLAGRPYLLSGGELLFLAVADVRVEGEVLEGVGVEPDIVVQRPIPFAAGSDLQLEAALAAALREIARAP